MASERGVLIVNITQCARGVVSASYASGKVCTNHWVRRRTVFSQDLPVLRKPGCAMLQLSRDQCISCTICMGTALTQCSSWYIKVTDRYQ